MCAGLAALSRFFELCRSRLCPALPLHALPLHSQNCNRLGHNHSQAKSTVWCNSPRPRRLFLTGPQCASFAGEVGAEASVYAGGAAAEQRGGGAAPVAHRQHALVCSHHPTGGAKRSVLQLVGVSYVIHFRTRMRWICAAAAGSRRRRAGSAVLWPPLGQLAAY